MRLFALKTIQNLGENLEIAECLEMYKGTVLSRELEIRTKEEWNYSMKTNQRKTIRRREGIEGKKEIERKR